MIYGNVGNRFRSVDNFDDGDLSEYGSDTQFSVQTTTVHDGAYALEMDSASSGSIQSLSGLDNYPAQGDTFEFWFQPGSMDSAGGVTEIRFGIQDGSNRYHVEIGDDDDVKVQSVVSGSYSAHITLNTVGMTAGAWHRAVVTWGDGTADSWSLEVFDSGGTSLGSGTGADSNYSSGVVGYYVDSGLTANWFVDSWRITG